MPKRIHRERTKGWRLPPNTVCVTRPGKWGNPFYPGSGYSMGYFDADMQMVLPPATPENCVKWYRKHIEVDQRLRAEAKKDLRGKNLACWCKVGEPCHADVLLEIANG